MKLDDKKIKSLIFGAVEFDEENGYIRPCRFTKEIIDFFGETNKERRHLRSFAMCGITMEFTTNSDFFSFDYECFQASGSHHYYFDVYIDGQYMYHIGNSNVTTDSRNFRIDLKKGTKKILIYFSNFFGIRIKNVEVSDNAKISTVKKDRKFLFYGDSITQGHTTDFPSFAFSNIVSRAFNAESLNKGIGGDYYYPPILDEKFSYKPDAIIVAFGTNDWSDGKDIEKNSIEFYDRLTKIYPGIKIFTLLPLWRGKAGKQNVITFDEMREILIKVCKNYKDITLIDAIDFIPHDGNFFIPDLLHPNTLGHKVYGENVVNVLKPFMA